MPVHFSPSSNRKELTQLLQGELFPTSTFNKPHLSHTSQRKPCCFTSSRTLTLPGAINCYDMGWRLAPYYTMYHYVSVYLETDANEDISCPDLRHTFFT
ncbi:hypothetical protein TNCV_3603961 [Trichonephila clavipes]|nr:hypothetical protein TNCV_3603961 [Trichonephila clavipes]